MDYKKFKDTLNIKNHKEYSRICENLFSNQEDTVREVQDDMKNYMEIDWKLLEKELD